MKTNLPKYSFLSVTARGRFNVYIILTVPAVYIVHTRTYIYNKDYVLYYDLYTLRLHVGAVTREGRPEVFLFLRTLCVLVSETIILYW